MTIWLLLLLVAAAVLLPLAVTLWRPKAERGRREADMALYRAQLGELDREREAGRLDEGGHRAARLEVQRRLIAAADQVETNPDVRRTAGAMMLLVPAMVIAGMVLYLQRGTPGMPSATYTERAAAMQRDEQILGMLRARLEALDPQSPQARQGWILLGNAERGRGRTDAAIDAWRRAIDGQFDASLAAEIAELEIERGRPAEATPWITRALAETPNDPRLRFLAGLVEAESGRPANARALWQALMTDTPADAPWRGMLERRLNSLP